MPADTREAPGREDRKYSYENIASVCEAIEMIDARGYRGWRGLARPQKAAKGALMLPESLPPPEKLDATGT